MSSRTRHAAAGPSPTPSPAVAPTGSSSDQDLYGNSFLQGVLGGGCDYTVQRGDTLWDIQRRQSGSGADWPSLYERNRSVVGENPNLILPGQQLDVCEAPPAAAPRLGVDAYDVVPDDFVGPLGPNQIRQSQRDDLDAFQFGDLNVVGDDFVGPLAPGQMTQSQYAELQSAWLNIADGRGMNVTGSEADQTAFRQMMRDGIGSSTTFRDLITSIGNDADPTHTVQAVAGRSQANVFGDSFASNEIDLDDLDQFPSNPSGAGVDAFSREDVIAHFLAERQDALTNGSAFDPAHQTGIDMQNTVRQERGALDVVSNTGSARADGGLDVSFNLSDGRAHTMVLGADANVASQVAPVRAP